MERTKHAGKLFGAFFILSFITYALGTSLIDELMHADVGLLVVHAHKYQFVTGALLITLFHTLFNTGLVVIMFAVLRSHHQFIAYAYVILACTATLLLAVGAVFLLLIIPLSDAYVQTNSPDNLFFETLLNCFTQANFFAYQTGMSLWGLGGLTLCYLLQRSQLVPVLLTLTGYCGYTLFILGTILELFGYEVGILLSIPGALFEISLSLWLILNGFRMNAYGYSL